MPTRLYEKLEAAEKKLADLQAALKQAQEERDRLRNPVPDDPNPCPRCGRRSGLCASVSSEDWFRITGHWNGGGYLCLWCMDALATEKGLSGIHCTLSFAGRAIWSDDDPVEEACQARTRGKLLWKQVIEEQTILRITTGFLEAAERDAKAQRALAASRERKLETTGDRMANILRGAHPEDPADACVIDALVEGWDELVAPAEALRAGGQEEGDDGS